MATQKMNKYNSWFKFILVHVHLPHKMLVIFVESMVDTLDAQEIIAAAQLADDETEQQKANMTYDE